MHADANATTGWLIEASNGSTAAVNQLLPHVYDELRNLAAAHLQHERPGHTLSPTALAHDAYFRLIDQDRVDWQNRAHFFALAAQAIRRILVDHARAKAAQKRGGDWQRITLREVDPDSSSQTFELLDLEEALESLRALNARHAQIVELRFYGGLTEAEVAEVLEVHRSTVADDWALARAWLSRRLTEGDE